MTVFYIGFILFFVPHFYSAMRSRAEGRDVRKRMGEAKYMGMYSVVTGIGLGLLIWGYVRAPDGAMLWAGPHELHHYAWVVMLATLIWAGLHLAMGGDVKRVLLFGGFAAYALVSLIFAYRRGTDLKTQQPRILGDVIAIIIGLVLTGALLHGGHGWLFGAPAM